MDKILEAQIRESSAGCNGRTRESSGQVVAYKGHKGLECILRATG